MASQALENIVKVRVSFVKEYDPSGADSYDDQKVCTEDAEKPDNLPYIIHAVKHEGSLPGLVIAVVGDSESFVPRPWNSTAFTSGLIQTVDGAKDTWIIYRGKEDGVSSLIFNAFKDDEQTKLIAIKPCSERTLTKIIARERQHLFCLELEQKVSFDGDAEDFKHEWYNDYLSRLLESVSKMYTTLLKRNNEVLLEMRVPVIMIVVEGDLTTIQQVESAVDRNVPVLVVKGSGKAANLIGDYLGEVSDGGREKLLVEKAALLFGIYIEKEEFEDLKRSMGRIAISHYMITVFDIVNPGDGKMEDFVVEAIIKGWSLEELDAKGPGAVDPPQAVSPNHDCKEKNRKRKTITCKVVSEGRKFSANDGIMEQYQFTLKPGSLSLYFYVAYQFIQEGSMHSKKKDLQLLLLEAIIADRADYVSAMMQNGVQFDPQYMNHLYHETLRCLGCDGKDCRYIHAIHYRSDKVLCEQMWRISDESNLGLDSCDVFMIAKQFCKRFLNYPKDDNYAWNQCRNENGSISHHDAPFKNNRDPIFHDLLAWALFANRKELAGVFWARCDNPLLTAVMASSILKNMAENVESAKDKKLHEDLMQHSKKFEERVLSMQDSLYEEKEIECMDLMKQTDIIWEIEVNPMECAYDNNMIDVIGHPCVQRLLNKTWYNESGTKWTEWIKSLLFWYGKEFFQKALFSPVMAFAVHYIFVLALLVCFSAFLLTNIETINTVQDVGVYEWLLYIWIIGDLIEEILRNIVLTAYRGGHIRFRFMVYIKSFWNFLTIFSHQLIISAALVRIRGREDYHRLEIRLFSFGLFTMYMRFLQSMLVLSYFGPKIIMIGKMLVELLKIGWIIIVFVMCTGVLYHANMYPSHYDMWSPHGATYWRIWKIMSLPYWQIYGELSLEEIKGDNEQLNVTCTNDRKIWEQNPDMERCVEPDWSLMIIAAIYMLITNLLLVNLVIALFSYRFEEVQSNSDRLWKFWRYSVITDFRTRFPVPLNLFIRPLHTTYKIVKCCSSQTGKNKIDQFMEKEQRLHAEQCLHEEKMKKQ